jgi:hypothetical protein
MYHSNITNLIHFHFHLTPETCRGLRHNKVSVKVNVYKVGYIIVMIETLGSHCHDSEYYWLLGHNTV